jgi:hypothetical protein
LRKREKIKDKNKIKNREKEERLEIIKMLEVRE